MCNLLDGLVALGCNEGCEGHGSANGLPQPRMELAERSHEHTHSIMHPSATRPSNRLHMSGYPRSKKKLLDHIIVRTTSSMP